MFINNKTLLKFWQDSEFIESSSFKKKRKKKTALNTTLKLGPGDLPDNFKRDQFWVLQNTQVRVK